MRLPLLAGRRRARTRTPADRPAGHGTATPPSSPATATTARAPGASGRLAAASGDSVTPAARAERVASPSTAPAAGALDFAGVVVALPVGWEARARRQDASRPGRPGNLLLHAATVPLPAGRGDFGSGVVDTLRSGDVFVSLFEYDREEAGTALFAERGLPRVRPADFSTGVMQRTIAGQSGAQWFFTEAGRAFCLHAVLGSHGRRSAGAVRLQELVDALTIGADR